MLASAVAEQASHIDDIDMDEMLRKFDETGYVVIPDVLGPEELGSVRQALDRALDENEAAGNPLRYGPNQSNRRVWALINRGEEFVRLALNPTALKVVRAVLGYDVVQLSGMSANITAPGGDSEIGRLHTDQDFLPQGYPYRAVSNVTFMLDDYTVENGATLFVPGSHKRRERPDFTQLAPTAEGRILGKAGSIAVWDGRLHHATGLNRTADQLRRGIIATFFAPYLRSQENWFETVDRRLFESYPGLAGLLGFQEWNMLGSVNGPRITSLNF